MLKRRLSIVFALLLAVGMHGVFLAAGHHAHSSSHIALAGSAHCHHHPGESDTSHKGSGKAPVHHDDDCALCHLVSEQGVVNTSAAPVASAPHLGDRLDFFVPDAPQSPRPPCISLRGPPEN